MDVNAVQIVLVFLVTFVAAIDQFDFLESLYQPIVTGAVIGAILGDINTGLIVGGTYQLMTIGNMPIGGAQPPNAVIGGIMAAVFACTLDMDPDMAVATAIPFALLGQYGVTLFFTLRAPLLEFFRGAAENADTKAITKWTIISECILGVIFAVIVTLFFIGGLAVGQQIVDAIPAWLNTGLSQAGNMMKFVGFAILLKIMMNRDMWGFFFMGFGLALIASNIEAIAGPALLILTLIGFGIAFWDFQQQTELKGAVADGGDFTDGI
ncbi:PTS mannose/fructose/sorbose/N-acetylgalactosamine transporter subunit IIC [Collinsella tanakaei]|uniref:PTS mannose/fructose/sorbose/N-acetylgalactosamine transporter subunit IIC n=1 Tax=Collinsella tanakaei TaxID=626935 RepID=UPI001F3F1A1A|nr:PTS sugar transporter subunit IIC [Collinsella tanakaei]MCF2621704.1 PTS sugar transporter subunit IIC [Collinsella tanakaei]MDM8301862.1 PTS sugar transporter subunit IIC [Collinsella tanakaei]